MSHTSSNILIFDYNSHYPDEFTDLRNKMVSKYTQGKIERLTNECNEIRLRTKMLIDKHNTMLINNEKKIGELEKKLTKLKFKMKEIPYIIINKNDSWRYEDNFVEIPLILTVTAILETPDVSETIKCSEAVFHDNWVYSYDFDDDRLISQDNMKILKKLRGFKLKGDGLPKNLDINIRKELQEGILVWEKYLDDHVERGISFIKDIECLLYLNIVGNRIQ